MALDLSLLGNKLKRYREQFQLSFEELSEDTGISPDMLKQYEQGQAQPSGDEILILADRYKCDYKIFISNDQVSSIDQTEILFRRYGNELSRDDRWAIQEVLFFAENEHFLEQALEKQQPHEFIFPIQGNYFKGQGIDAAESLRRFLNHAPNAVPLNVYNDFRSIGIRVFGRDLDNSNISGLCIQHPIAGKCILINYVEDIYRQRFSAAHEAAHAIFDLNQEISMSFTNSEQSIGYVEVHANTFASHYLIPPEFLRAIPNSSRWNAKKAVEWASRLKVSTEALAYALSQANLINNQTVDIIKGTKVPSTEKSDPELPSSLSPRSLERKAYLLKMGLSDHYVKLCFEGYQRGVISAARIAEMLLVDDGDLHEIAALYGGVLQSDVN